MKIGWDPEARQWFDGLQPRQAESLAPAFNALARLGRDAPRRYVKRIKSSRHPEMYELRSVTGNRRILFGVAQGTAMMFTGGDKTGLWNEWYPPKVREADRKMDLHLQSIGQEAAWRTRRTGVRSAARER